MNRLVLLIENGRELRPPILEALASGGFELVTASDIKEARQSVVRHRPALMIIAAPSWPSVQNLLSELQSEVCTRGIRKILVCSASGESDSTMALDAGADDLIKPTVSPRELLARIRSVLRTHMS